jgi:hypothetical protein
MQAATKLMRINADPSALRIKEASIEPLFASVTHD